MLKMWKEKEGHCHDQGWNARGGMMGRGKDLRKYRVRVRKRSKPWKRKKRVARR